MDLRTPLYATHVALGGKLVDFHGWQLPVHYGSQLEEHRATRSRSGMFDVSHMTVLDLSGAGSKALLERVIANDINRLAADGDALYGLALNSDGGILDDLVVYRLAEGYRVIANCATRAPMLAWFAEHAGGAVNFHERHDLAMIAVQGPEAVAQVGAQLPRAEAQAVAALAPFKSTTTSVGFIARTGYTGEDGCEILLPEEAAAELWSALARAGVTPAGLGARDSLRLEAGLNLYGQDMDATTHPFESNLGWTVALEPRARDFIGRRAVEAVVARGTTRLLRGLVLEGKGVLRRGQVVQTPAGTGVITSGGYSPQLQRSIGLARLPAATAIDTAVQVEIRSQSQQARVVRPRFVRRGKVLLVE